MAKPPVKSKWPSLSQEELARSPEEVCAHLANAFFGDEGVAREIMFKLTLAREMQHGAERHQRPAIRRDKLAATVKTILKLQDHLDAFDRQTIANALGRIEPQLFPIAPDTDGNPLLAGLHAAAPVPGLTPALLQAYDTMWSLLDVLRSGMAAMATTQQGVRRGRTETADSLNFAVDGLTAVWRQHRGKLATVSSVTGGFGDFAVLALGTCHDIYDEDEVRTSLRRLGAQIRKPPA